MIVNRLDLLRVLDLIQTVGQTEVLLKADGSFGVPGTDGTSLVLGKGVSLGQDVAILDVTQIKKILNSLIQLEVNITIDKGFFTITAGDLKYSCRLADSSLIESVTEDVFNSLVSSGWDWMTGTLSIEDIQRISKLIKTLSLGMVEFKGVNGSLSVVVGDKNYFYGELAMNKVAFEGSMSFETALLDPVLGALDAAKVVLNFGLRTKVDPATQLPYTEGVLTIATTDSKWLLGSLQGK